MPDKQIPISQAVIRRLPRYLRQMDILLAANISRVSSGELALSLGLTASQIRQDLSRFGGFGQQGYGYQTRLLRDSIANILGLNKGYKAVLIGAGNLGKALLGKFSGEFPGFSVTAAFDIAPSVESVGGIEILHIDMLDDYIRKSSPRAAILTLPSHAAHDVAKKLARLGVTGILNFTEADLQGLNLIVENVPLADSLMALCYRVLEQEEKS